MSLSVPKPALTNALTNVDARFCRAESTAGPVAARPSTRCILYTCRAPGGRQQVPISPRLHVKSYKHTGVHAFFTDRLLT